MPNLNHVSNTDKPLVRNPRYEDRGGTEQQSLTEMHDKLGRQADAIDGERGKQAESEGAVTRGELDQILAQHQAQMQGILKLFEMLQKDDPRRGTPDTEDFLAEEKKIQEHTLDVLRTSPRVAVYIVPMPYEADAIAQSNGEPLYRAICINGILTYVAVGQVVNVPEPVAEVIHNAKDGGNGKWRAQQYGPPLMFNDSQRAQDLETIPRPAPQPLADEMGRSGVVGHDVFRPFSSERPRPLDVR